MLCARRTLEGKIWSFIPLLGPQEGEFRGGLIFCPWCFFFQRRISELPRPIAVKLRRMMGSWLNFIMQVHKFGGRSPNKIWRAKNMQNSVDFCNVRFWSRISPERIDFWKARPLNFGRAKNRPNFGTIFDFDREYLRKGSTYRKSGKKLVQQQPLPRWAKKNLVNFGQQTTEIQWCILTHPNWFSGDYISALKGCSPFNFFIHARHWPMLPSAPPIGDGRLPKILMAKT